MDREQEFNITQAILSIRPEAEFTIGGNFDYASLTWLDKNQVKPTEKEFNDAVTAWNTEWEALQYQRDRQYPSIGDQLDMQYWDSLNGTTTWKDAVAKVKADNPKE